ncbi:STAS domain-containing protein [Nocardia blacklockiae]|uniref:STAS domain-containing protein n=1 Tax=Nocardia blacklockiae TaxID=480036 RepID=UPI001894BF3F|nr:STAS domain-containing protein [Nocardia blacklockiae]MBF6175709.1 STAS domain-containing protein [Nocardia blacklockiae]
MSAIAVLHRHIDAADPDGLGPPPTPVRDRRRQHTVVRVEGELDAAVAAMFGESVARAVDTTSRAVVLDLRRTRFLSIGSARALAAAKAAAATAGVDLRLVCGRREIERVLEITGMRPLFRYYATMQAALER